MDLNGDILNGLSRIYGDAFYLLDSGQFKKNFQELKNAFSSIYSKFNVAYSYKTNYTPAFCRIINRLGGFAEVVSDMELEIALRIGVPPERIIWNGPYKNAAKVKELLFLGGTVNLDSAYETELVKKIATEYPDRILNIGIRCNFEINDNVISRFGFDTESGEFEEALNLDKLYRNIHLKGMQCHFASRKLETWRARAEGMLNLLDRLGIIPEHVDLGGGLFGKMADSLKIQFDSEIPDYGQYACATASLFAEHYKGLDYEKKPLLLLEPGSALVGDCMSFVTKVINVKTVRGKAIATVLGSIYNINPTLNKKNPPLEIYHMGGKTSSYEDLDFGGFTCIESDYVYRGFCGELAAGDFVVFGNAGSYSIVLKPPFILPNFPVLDICSGECRVIKRKECFDDLFHTFDF